jgi:hypothetical protein
MSAALMDQVALVLCVAHLSTISREIMAQGARTKQDPSTA